MVFYDRIYAFTSMGITLLAKENLWFNSYTWNASMFGGVLTESMVTECAFNFILPLVLIIGSIVGVVMLCTTIWPFTHRQCLSVMLKPVHMWYNPFIVALII